MSIDKDTQIYIEAAAEFADDLGSNSRSDALLMSLELVKAHASSGSSSAEDLVTLQRDMYFMYQYGLTFHEYLVFGKGYQDKE